MVDITDIADLSIQRRAEGKLQPEAWGTNFWVVTSAEGEVAPWWSQQRDNDLREFWMKAGNDVLQGAVSSMVKKFKAMSWALEGPEAKDPDAPEPGTVEYHQQVLSEAEFGKGWGTLLGKVLTDYLVQDRGAFIELIGEGDPAGPVAKPGVRGLAHLDSGLCTLTGDTEFPVVFNNPKTGKPHKLHATRVIHLVDMPSPVESMNEVGFCACSRCIASSQVLLKLAKYKNEKLSDLPQAGLLILNNILPAKFDDAKAGYEAERRKLGQELWANIMTLFGYDPSNPVSADFLSFANLPDGFNEQQAYELYVRIVALSFGVDIREFWPVSGGQLGTATESLVMHQKARGKGVGEVIASIERAINWKALPATVTFRFDFQDDEEDEQKARIADQKAVTLMRLWQPAAAEGEPQLVTRDEMRQMLAEHVPYFKPDFLTLAASSETTVSDTERKALGFGRDVKLWSDGRKEYRRLRLGKKETERVLDAVLDNYQAGRVRVEDLARFALAELADVG
jgi:hypothetical protein